MAHVADYDFDNKVIYISIAPVGGVITVDVQVDLYSHIKKDWLDVPAYHKFKFPFAPVGGNLTKPPTKISPYYFLLNGWKMRPYEANHTLYLTNGYLLVDGGGDPWLPTLGTYTVNIRDTVPADAYATSQAISAGDLTNISDAVWEKDVGTPISNSFGDYVANKLLTLAKFLAVRK